VKKFIRYSVNSSPVYGLLEGDAISELDGDLFRNQPTGTRRKLGEVKLLTPCEPRQIIAVGRNYKSHLEGRPMPSRPEMFYKPISSLQGPDGPIVLPPDATNTHSEGELVLVMGRRLHRATREEAEAAVFGVTCGNDVSERNWQNGADKDIQWWRAKGSDTFSPLGPAIVTDLDYGNLQLTTRMNGEVVQDQSTADLIFDCPTMLSFVSQYITLEPGDVIYTGTPGSTRKMKPGDTIEVEIQNIGILRNPVVGPVV
jgi:2-keto-4-pentenoate hydratase/2-oxohepta-3-ene-1,7-dioic acid hydratase in catechol pathway